METEGRILPVCEHESIEKCKFEEEAEIIIYYLF